MTLLTLEDIEKATPLVYAQMAPTPQYLWPQICDLTGATVWVKHENHTPTGAFKVRGGITFIDWLKRSSPNSAGIVTATRGNHGQSQARAATAAGLTAKIVVPHNNSVEKNAAMRAFGGTVIEHGKDFDEARVEAQRLAEVENLVSVPPFHPEIVRGVATYALELFTAIKDLDTVYVPIGCGSGICSLITVRDILKLKTKIVGVVSTEAQGAKLSFEAGHLISTPSAQTFADGMAVRVPVEAAFAIYAKGADRIVAVSDDGVAAAMRIYYRTTHNVAEGAGAAPLAALIQEKDKMQGKTVGVILCGGNVDAEVLTLVLQGKTP
ncbi:MAG: threonine dehydratase [Cyanobacteria bacterium P01_D01_bin.115]